MLSIKILMGSTEQQKTECNPCQKSFKKIHQYQDRKGKLLKLKKIIKKIKENHRVSPIRKVILTLRTQKTTNLLFSFHLSRLQPHLFLSLQLISIPVKQEINLNYDNSTQNGNFSQREVLNPEQTMPRMRGIKYIQRITSHEQSDNFA